MKFTCERDSLLKVLTDASRGVPSRPERAILNCLHLSLDGDLVSVTATDLNLWIRSQTRVADGGVPGMVAIHSRYLVEAVRSCEPGVIDIESEDNKTYITSGASKFTFNTLPAENFPELPETDVQETSVDVQDFLDALGRVVIARSTDEARTVLTSVLMTPEEFESGEKGLRLVCTDSYRLALRDLAGFQLEPLKKDILVPGRTLEEINRHAGEAKEISVGISEKQITFTIGDVYFLTQLIEGDYPKYKNLIPKGDDYPNCLTIDKGDSNNSAKDQFKRAINQVRIMAGADTPIRLTMKDSKLIMRASSDYGEGDTELDVNYNDDEMTVAFNPRYLLDGIDACPGEEISIYTQDALKPAVLRGVPKEDFLYLLMPVRVTD